MTMNNMVAELEKEGFKVTKKYEGETKQYCFTVEKDNVTMVKYFDWLDGDTNSNRDRRQRNFISGIVLEYEVNTATTIDNQFKDMVDAYEASLPKPFKIKVVHFSGGVTTVIWEDGTKSQVRCQDGDDFDPEKGLALAIAKRVLGNKGSWYDEIKKWTEPYHRKVAQQNYDTILKMFGIDLKVPKLRIGNFECDHDDCGGIRMTYVGPQDADEAKRMEENKEKKETPAPVTDTTPTPANGKTPNGGVRCSTCKHVYNPVTQNPCSSCDWHYSSWEPEEEVIPPAESKDKPQTTHYNPVEEAYNIALKIRDGKHGDIEALIGFLGEALNV